MLQRVHSDRLALGQQGLVGQADVVLSTHIQILRHGFRKRIGHQGRSRKVVGAARRKLGHAIAGVGLLLLDVLNPPICFAQVGVVGMAQTMRMKTPVSWNGTRAARLSHKLLEVCPIPVAGEITIVHHHRLVGLEQMRDLQNRIDRTELVRCYTDNPARGAVALQRLRHAVLGVVEVVLVANKNEICLAGKQVHDMGHDRLAVNFYQGLRYAVARAAETLAKSRHRNNDLHKKPLLKS